MNQGENKIAILSNCNSELIKNYIKVEAEKRKIFIKCQCFDYSRMSLSVLNPDFVQLKPEVVIIVISSHILYEEYQRANREDKSGFAERYIREINDVWKVIQENGSIIFQTNCIDIPDNTHGNCTLKFEDSFLYQIRKLNYLLAERCKNNQGIIPFDILKYQSRFGYDYVFSADTFFAALMPYSLPFIKLFVREWFHLYESVNGLIVKCIVVDLDNTIWGGIVSEDGIGELLLSGSGEGRAFHYFQLWLKSMKESGLMLAICSKNDHKLVFQVFKEREDMVLKWEDFSAYEINWDNKAQGIERIKNRLGISFDNMVFIDDSIFERENVKNEIPELIVPDMPQNPSKYIEFLSSLNIFESCIVDNLGEKRAAHFKNESKRDNLRLASLREDVYLKKLEMKLQFARVTRRQSERVAQLLNRCNRFNLRTKRATVYQVEQLIEDDSCYLIYFTLEDIYEDYGIISVIIGKKIDDDKVFIDNWVLSCRAFGRGVETAVCNSFVSLMKQMEIKQIVGEYIPNNKNEIVKELFSKLGFDICEDGTYILNVDSYSDLTNYISVEYGGNDA